GYVGNAIGSMNTASGSYASAVGYKNTASGVKSNAIGNENTASEEYTNAVGAGNRVSGYASSAFGNNNEVTAEFASAFGHSNNISGYVSNALGYDNAVSGDYSTAVGLFNNVGGNSSHAFGYGNNIAANSSSAVGNGNTISTGADDSFALGNDTSISLANSVALGSNSAATAINSVTGNSSYTKWAGVSDVVGVVSVGSSGSTRQIQNVAAGQVSATSTDAVNGSQLYEVAQKAAQQATVSAGDSNVVVTPTTNSSGGTDYEVKLADELQIGTGVNVDGTGDGKIDVGNGNVVIDGSDGSITAGGVTINKDDEGTINGLTNTTWDPDNYVSGQAATEDQLKAIHDKAAEAAELAAKHTTMEAVDNNILIEKSTNADGGDHHELKLNDVVEIGSGANKVTIDGTNGTVSTGNINMNGTNGMITADKITIDGGSGTIGGLTNTTWDADNYVSGQAASEDQLKTVYDTAVKYDVDSGGNINTGKITLEGSSGTTIGNVAAGEVSATSMDAVNGSQLYQVKQDINNINQDITKLGDEIDTVGALSAAMAGLHPRFQDGNKGELAMAYGGYGGKSALAVGGFYAPNEKVMFSLGLGISEGGSKMGNFGVNFALDRSRDRKAEPRDIIYTRKEVDNSLAAQDEKIQLLLAKVEEQSREMEKQSREIEYLRAQVEK
ncbi:YadA-like family protein, partial [Phascolarctobacterium faecium]|uniref:YadA-like family protein n=2 Tax=Phascolarctobacterium faecium TaxID=33025 RepID=UPI003FD89F48